MSAKMLGSLQDCCGVTLRLSGTRINKVEDLWSLEKISFKTRLPRPSNVSSAALEEITFRSIKAYLDRPGHVQLPNDMISCEDIAAARTDKLLRANLLLGYWHGSRSLPCRQKYTVSDDPYLMFPRHKSRLPYSTHYR